MTSYHHGSSCFVGYFCLRVYIFTVLFYLLFNLLILFTFCVLWKYRILYFVFSIVFAASLSTSSYILESHSFGSITIRVFHVNPTSLVWHIFFCWDYFENIIKYYYVKWSLNTRSCEISTSFSPGPRHTYATAKWSSHLLRKESLAGK